MGVEGKSVLTTTRRERQREVFEVARQPVHRRDDDHYGGGGALRADLTGGLPRSIRDNSA